MAQTSDDSDDEIPLALLKKRLRKNAQSRRRYAENKIKKTPSQRENYAKSEQRQQVNSARRERYAEASAQLTPEQRQEANLARRERDAEASAQLTPQQRQEVISARRERNTGARRRNTVARVGKSDICNIVEFSLGVFSFECQFCGSKNFKSETPRDQKFTYCCQKGKVKLKPFPPYPEFMKNLLTSNESDGKNFRDNIRSFNSALAFASMGGSLATFKTTFGPYCFKIHGQTYHLTSQSTNPEPGNTPRYAQLYILDSDQALNQRMSVSQNAECFRETMGKLSDFITANNVIARSYKMMADVERDINVKGTGFPSLTLSFKKDPKDDQRRYNAPSSSNEIAVVFQNVDGEPPFDRDLKVYNKASNLTQQISILNPKCDPMVYPILFPFGNDGWGVNFRSVGSTYKISQMDYYAHLLAVRDGFNPFLAAGKLTQQFIVDAYVKIEANRLNFIRQNQNQLRVEQYSGLMDHINSRAEQLGLKAGTAVILPSSFQGSPRNMAQAYQDAMAIVRKFGSPHYFVTITCNPNWKEITENLGGVARENRPDLIARVFNQKVNNLMDEITKDGILGRVVGKVHVVEFQKRGLPHVHLLIIVQSEDQPRSREDIDKVVWAEIPDAVLHPDLHVIVTKHMIHGPCGEDYPYSPCMENGQCTKGFPKDFESETRENVDGYPRYQRRKLSSLGFPPCTVRNKEIDNNWVVPYNPYLSLKYNCHINVEICASVKSVKYLFKYVYKGYDCANIEITQSGGSTQEATVNRDELKLFVDSRYISAPEAIWRIYGFKMHHQSHPIIRLAIHLPRKQPVYFKQGQEQQAIEKASTKDTTLTAWFKLNEVDPRAREYLYTEVPDHYVFHKPNTVWKPRQSGSVISRMYAVSLTDSERYHLRLLLLNFKGAQSFEDLRSFEGILYPTFKDAASARHLLADDTEWDNALKEGALTQMPKQLRELFAFICVFGGPSNAPLLWDNYKLALMEDFTYQNLTNPDNLALWDIGNTLKIHGKRCSDFGLPEPDEPTISVQNEQFIPELERAQGELLRSQLNDEQRHCFDLVMEPIENDESPKRVFFLDGPGGTGKTFLYNTLMCVLRGRSEVVLPVAPTGIAATLLKGGRTYHSQFKLPVPLTETSVSRIRCESIEARRIKATKLILWDEASMTPGLALLAVDRLLKEITGKDTPFGGKVMLFGGDFRQTLPVVPRSHRVAIVQTTMKYCSLWCHFTILRLTQNIRTGEENDFAQWIIKLGEGEIPNLFDLGDDVVEIPAEFLSKNSLITDIFGTDFTPLQSKEFANRAILCPKNEHTFVLNDNVLDRLQGEKRIYYSVDSVQTDDEQERLNFPTEFLNTLTPSGMPLYSLKLKVGAIIMLLRNLNTRKGLCNGTRLIIKEMKTNIIIGENLTGASKGETVFIPRIDLAPSDSNMPFVLKRRQFPVRVAYAITINKSQGQTLERVGIFLQEPVFAHGQLYVAFSRATSKNNVKVTIVDSDYQGALLKRKSNIFTKNVVYKEIL